MMRIAIEAQRIFRANKHGMDFVALELIRGLQNLDKTNEYHILVSPGPDMCLRETPNFHIHIIGVSNYLIWEQVSLPLAIRRIKPDMLHCTSNTAPLTIKGTPLILTLHDVIFMEKREKGNMSLYQNLGWYYRRFVVPRIVRRCKRIITVSNYEKANIVGRFPSVRDNTVVVYNGYGKHFRPIENCKETVRKYTDSERYFFFLGNTDPKKNTRRVLKAYSIYVSQTDNPADLLVADLPCDIVDKYLDELDAKRIRPLIKIPGYIPNTDLPYLYNGCVAFIYASLRESFGIPLLEAMACHVPVITSSVSSMPEIAGDKAYFVNPLDEQEIAREMLRLDNAEVSKEYIDGCESVCSGFSWERTASETLRQYSSVYADISKN